MWLVHSVFFSCVRHYCCSHCVPDLCHLLVSATQLREWPVQLHQPQLGHSVLTDEQTARSFASRWGHRARIISLAVSVFFIAVLSCFSVLILLWFVFQQLYKCFYHRHFVHRSVLFNVRTAQQQKLGQKTNQKITLESTEVYLSKLWWRFWGMVVLSRVSA